MSRHLSMLLCVVALVFGVSGIAQADFEDAPAKPKREKKEKVKKERPPKVDRAQAQATAMADALDFTEAQREKLAGFVAERAAALKAFETNNKEAIDSAKAAIKAAKDDKEAANEAKKKLGELMAQRKEIEKAFDENVMGLLTDAQKSRLAGLKVLDSKLRSLKRAKPALDDAQKARIRTLCEQAARDMANIKEEDKKKQAAAKKIQKDLEAQISEVLTDEQAESLKKKDKPAREPKQPKPRKEKKQDDEDEGDNWDDEM